VENVEKAKRIVLEFLSKAEIVPKDVVVSGENDSILKILE
jgi:hypothetical protein